MASSYLTPKELEKLFKNVNDDDYSNGQRPSKEAVEQVAKQVPWPPFALGPVMNRYPVAPQDEGAFEWTGGLPRGESLELDIMLLLRFLCRENGIAIDLSEMLFVHVMASPLPATNKRSIPDWLKEDYEVTKERYDDHPWWHPPGMPWEEVLELVKARREEERRIMRETLEHT